MKKPVLLVAAAAVAVGAVALFLFSGEEPDETLEPTAPVAVRTESVAERSPQVDLRAARDEAAAVAVAAAEEAAPEGPPESYTRALGGLKGRLVEQDGTPAAGFEVVLLGGTIADFFPSVDGWFAEEPPAFDEVKGEATTGEDGRFQFEGLEIRGFHALGIELGRPRAALRFVDHAPNPGEMVDLGDIVLDAYVTFLGRVVDERSNPIPGARVRATNLPSVIFTFGVQELRPGFSVAFREALDADWRVAPIPRWATRLLDRFPIPQTTSGADGTFVLEGVPIGVISVLVDKPGRLTLVHGPVPSGAGGERKLGDLRVVPGQTLTGVVLDSAGEPIPGAEVMVGQKIEMAPAAILRPAIETDEEGRFRATGLQDAEHVVAARAPSGIEWTVEADVFPGDEVEVRLGDRVHLDVIVTNPAGELLPKPDLVLQPRNDLPLHPLLVPPIPLAGRLEHLEDGRVRILDLEPGRYSVLARAAGFAVAQEDADLTEGAAQVALQLAPQFVAEVVVLEAGSKAPVPWAAVAVLPDKEGFGPAAPLVTRRSDEHGLASLDGLPAGEFRVKVFHPGFAEGNLEIEVPGPPESIELRQGGVLEGRIHAGGQPPDDDRMIGLGVRQGESFPRVTVTAADGSFRVTHLEPGDYNVTIMRRFADRSVAAMVGAFESMMPERFEQVTIVEGEVTRLDVDLLGSGSEGATAKLRGRVTLNGGPGASMQVQARPQGEWRGRKSTVTDAFGAYDFGEVKAGEVRVSVTQPGKAGSMIFGRLAELKLELAEGEVREQNFDIRTGRLRGTVLDAASGAPIPAAEIELDAEGPADGPSSNLRTVSGKDGGFELEYVPQGTYSLEVQRDDYAEANVRGIVVPFNGEPAPVLVRMMRGVVAGGTITFPADQQPQRFAMLRFESLDESGGGGNARVDVKTGRFEADSLMPGRYKVTAFGDSGAWQPVEVTVPVGGTTTLDLAPQPMDVKQMQEIFGGG